jgi:hypothetical protein
MGHDVEHNTTTEEEWVRLCCAETSVIEMKQCSVSRLQGSQVRESEQNT